jgi:putative acetyltransferase
MRPIAIRDERPDDAAAVHAVNLLAFGQDQEARIVDQLRSNGGATLSLVATIGERVVGHIMYSPVCIGDVTGAGLAPMAVLPDRQRQGIGSALVRAGNQRLKDSGHPFIVVLGHPTFYPRFGFTPASAYRVACEWDVPDDVFMMLVFDGARMDRVSGLARYRPEFGGRPT